ncbi:cytochrome-c oxidase [Desulfuromonas versatilis]|uniref:Cytochrome-c oxidase n=1 Tax=Desulfuromonas versatilis TaxID=2802975 RepID=A0ABM8HSS0_9BACT|nr:SCO family protein [Desulfuromonas versatilis]BCR06055.1 cytochrome-c oxidase [Desulfuromonas versatilis]
MIQATTPSPLARALLPALPCVWLLAALAFALVPAASLGGVQPAGPSPIGVEERLGESIPLDLSFTDEEGRRVLLKELISRPTIIAPVYYRCSNVCNFLQVGLARSLPELKLKPGEDFQVLSISFDETETPHWARNIKRIHMAAMGGKFPEQSWRFLTGELEDIQRLTEAAGYRYQRQGVDFLHPVAVFVVTADGKIVRYLYGTSYLPMDLTLSLMEAAEGRVGPTIRKVVEFCFSYDPANKTYVFNLLRVSGTIVFLTAAGLLTFLVVTGRRKNLH